MKKILFALISLSMLSIHPLVAQEEKKYDVILQSSKCMGCHGTSFEKSALGGKSKIVSQMSNEEIKKSLLGYKDGTYGGKYQRVMQGTVSYQTEEELVILADYITQIINK